MSCLALYAAFVALNLVAAVVAVVDKARARSRARDRVPHATLRLLALLGGAPGLLVAMFAVRHKTRRTGLLLGLVLIGALSLAGWAWLLRSTGCL